MYSSDSVCVCVCVCVHCAKYLKKLWTDFDEILCRGGTWPREQSIRFWWRSRSVSDGSGSRIRIQGFLMIIYWIFGEVGRGPKTIRLWRQFHHIPDPGFLDTDHNRDPGIFNGFFIYCCDSYRQPRIKHDNPRRSSTGWAKKRGHSVLQKYCSDLHNFFAEIKVV